VEDDLHIPVDIGRRAAKFAAIQARRLGALEQIQFGAQLRDLEHFGIAHGATRTPIS
jgi:hypothetical protein